MGVTLRRVRAEDDAFLQELYASTRASELALVPWSPEQKAAFMRQQFDAQTTHYRKHFKDASFDIIERDGRPIGRLYIDRTDREIRIIDIALSPRVRNGGVGSRLLRDLLDEARASGRCVSLHVELGNPARALYERLGFNAVHDTEFQTFMQWSPDERASDDE